MSLSGLRVYASLLNPNKSATKALGHGRGVIVYVQLLENPGYVLVYCVAGDSEGRRDFSIREATTHEIQNLAFARGQLQVSAALSQ